MAIACSTSVACNSPLETALGTIQRIGIPKIDLLTIGTWAHVNVKDLAADPERTIARVQGLLRQHGLTPVAMNTGTSVQLHDRSDAANEQRRKELRAIVQLANRLGVTTAAIQPLGKDGKRPWEESFRDCLATLREQLEIGRAGGLQFVMELHVHSPFETLEQGQRLLEAMPDLPVVYDPTHFVMQGLDVKQTGWLMARARHAHLRDAAKGKLQAPLGEGSVDFGWLLNALKDRGYAGGFSIEYLESKDFDVPDSARRLYDLITRHFTP